MNKILNKVYGKYKKVKANVFHDFWFYSVPGLRNKKQLLKLKNIYQGKRCFIMGNGPSLLKGDLTLLKNEVTIASNAHFLIWDKIDYKPTFLTVEDRLVAEDRKDQLNTIDGVTKIFPLDLAKFLKLDDNTLYVNFLRNYKGFPQFTESFQDKVYWGGTVSFLNLQLAYYLGCSEIYLIGFDHEYKVVESIDEQNVITSDKDDVNHIHPEYFGKGYRWHDPNVDRMQEGYIKAKTYLEAKGIKIYNATIGGKLEVFQRVNYNSLFKNNQL